MADIDTLSDAHWATSGGVRDKIDIPHKGDPTDVTRSITSATDTVQAWWQDATGGEYPDDLPDAAELSQENPLLVTATEYLAASEEHEKRAEQVRAAEDQRDPKWVFLERRAHSKFDDWVTRHGYDDTGGDGGTPTGTTPTTSPGRIGSLVDLGSNGGGGA